MGDNMVEFPRNFFWGAATSAYQVEGNNANSDWWQWEKVTGVKEPSGLACRHYEFYRQDFALARDLNHNAHRLSVEWARIQPSSHEFSQKETSHYLDVISSLKENRLEPIVTLHHFTNPAWLSRIGGWQNKKSADYFLGYVEHIVGALCDKVNYWVTINEPMVYVYLSYIKGIWPPQEKSFSGSAAVTDNLILAHIKAYRLIRQIYKNKGLPLPRISIAQSMQAFTPCAPTLKNKLAVCLRDRFFNFNFVDRLIRKRTLDFIGLNYYTRGLTHAYGWGLKSLLLDNCRGNHDSLPKNSLGWDIYPQGLGQLLLKIKKYDLEVLILENGICTEDDNLRWEFIREHLKNISLAMDKGVKVSGYIYWSLLDNYEWDKGFGPRFGLIGVDYSSYKRTVRQSARNLAEVAKTGRLD